MASASMTQVLAAARQWLKPLVHVLVRCGVTWKDFAELAKTAYVEVATEQFGKRGRPTNVSRTAVLTGLARREVRKQRERLNATPQARLCGASDVRATTLLKELRAAGAIRETADGRLEALKRVYIPQTMEEQLIRLWGTVIADVATTYGHNLMRRPDVPARFERAALNDRVLASALPEFRKFLNREGQVFLERVDAWLTEHEARPNESESDSNSVIRLGAGVYHLQD